MELIKPKTKIRNKKLNEKSQDRNSKSLSKNKIINFKPAKNPSMLANKHIVIQLPNNDNSKFKFSKINSSLYVNMLDKNKRLVGNFTFKEGLSFDGSKVKPYKLHIITPFETVNNHVCIEIALQGKTRNDSKDGILSITLSEFGLLYLDFPSPIRTDSIENIDLKIFDSNNVDSNILEETVYTMINNKYYALPVDLRQLIALRDMAKEGMQKSTADFSNKIKNLPKSLNEISTGYPLSPPPYIV